jgi:hypothetical protein
MNSTFMPSPGPCRVVAAKEKYSRALTRDYAGRSARPGKGPAPARILPEGP